MIRAPKKLAALEAPKQQPEFCRTNSDTGTAYAARLDRGATQLTQPIVSREVGAPPPYGFLSGVLQPTERQVENSIRVTPQHGTHARYATNR
jgi:hypothetical protein